MDYKEVLKANNKYHNRHAGEYDDFIMRGNFRRAESVFKNHPGKRFLDMGCGTGKHLQIAKKYFEMVYGIDCSDGMIELAKKTSDHVRVGDVADTKFPSGYFDFINCFSVLHHLYEQEPAIKEAFRILKLGGVFYSDNDPNIYFYKKFKWWLTIRRFFKKRDKLKDLAEYHMKNGLDPEKMAEGLKSAGFRNVYVAYLYPENPDNFTKVLMWLNKKFKSRSLCYYFAILAIK